MEESTYISIEMEELKRIAVAYHNWLYIFHNAFIAGKYNSSSTYEELFDVFYKEYNAKKYKAATKQ